MTRLVAPTAKPLLLKPVRGNAGLEVEYRRRLMVLVDEMQASVEYWIAAAYKANTPEITLLASDISPAQAMRRAMAKVARRWLRNFDRGAAKLAEMFADKATKYSDTALAKVLKNAGFTVEFRMTPVMQDAYQAVIGEQVGLIRSIAQQHLTQVETLVMQSVQNGRSLGELSTQLQARYGVTKKRAALIARDQNNKATGTIVKARQLSLGITTAKWKHSHAGKVPRPSHVEADGTLYNVAEGCYIDGKFIQPGEEINCRCTSQPVIPGFED
jgi:SPP1 gp7 family putative phage head morphogenesis protein